MAVEDRVSRKNLVSQGGFKQPIKSKTWTALKDEDSLIEVVMPEGSTKVNVWVSFNQPTTGKPKNFQFWVMRSGGNFTARKTIPMPTLTDVGLTYEWELWVDAGKPIWIEVQHDGTTTIEIDGFEVHYKHIPKVY